MEDIFISSINVDKIRNIENLRIDISDTQKKHLILTGKNGSGKTTLLQNIRDYLRSLDTNYYFDLQEINRSLPKLYEDLSNCKKNDNLDDEYIKNIYELIDYYEDKKLLYGRCSNVIIKNDNKLQQLYNKGEFIVSYFGAKRNADLQTPRGIEKIYLKESYKLNEKPASIFLKYLVDLKTQQSFAKNEGDLEFDIKIKTWFDNFENALKELFDDSELKLKFDYRNYNFTIKEKDKNPYRFSELSDGYSAVLDIVIDLIMRMEKKSSRIYNLSGIVMIDEIETHLHIELQKRIMRFLTKLFPNIQFIVTTHSPFILNSTENAIIYDLENKIQVQSLTSYSYEGVVEEYFNINQYSQEIIKKVERYEYLINIKEKTDNEIDEMYEIRDFLGCIPNHSKELKSKFLELEIKRKTLND